MVNTRKPPIVVPTPTPPSPLLIGSAEDAARAFGENSDLHRHVRSFFGQTRTAPVVLVRPWHPEDDTAAAIAQRAWALLCDRIAEVAAGADPALLEQALLAALRAVAENAFAAGQRARPAEDRAPLEPADIDR